MLLLPTRPPWREYQLQCFTFLPLLSSSSHCIPPVHPPLMEQSPNGSSKLFTDVLCLCAIHESRAESSCQCPRPYCPRSRAMWLTCHLYVNWTLCIRQLALSNGQAETGLSLTWVGLQRCSRTLFFFFRHKHRSINKKKNLSTYAVEQCLCNAFPLECVVSWNIFPA